jgi:hypothetical protein
MEDFRRVKEANFKLKRQLFGADTCDLIGPVLSDGGSSGDSLTKATLAMNVECFITEVSGADALTVLGGESYTATHRIEMIRTPSTLAITPRYKLRVHARGDEGERYFDNPIRPADSRSRMVVLKATLVQQGYGR